MILRGVVVSKTITANGVFARIRVKGLPKNGSMRFFDVPDEENFEIGKKVIIGISVTTMDYQLLPVGDAPDEWTALPSDEELKDAIPGCMFHSAPGPADIVGAESVVLDPLNVPADVIVIDDYPAESRGQGTLPGGNPWGTSIPGCESPASQGPILDEENYVRGGRICLDKQGHQEL